MVNLTILNSSTSDKLFKKSLEKGGLGGAVLDVTDSEFAGPKKRALGFG